MYMQSSRDSRAFSFDFVDTFPIGYERDPELNPIVLDPTAARAQFEADIADTGEHRFTRRADAPVFVPPEPRPLSAKERRRLDRLRADARAAEEEAFYRADVTAAYEAAGLTSPYDNAAPQQPEQAPSHQADAVAPDEGLPVFSAASLAGRPLPPREWAVPDLIPFDTVTMLSGDGGVGKSLLAAQLAVAVASDAEWLGLKPACGPVVFVSAEDDSDELHRRFAAIAESEGIDLASVHDLHIVPLAGRDAVMGATEGRNSAVKETAVWRSLVRLVERVKPYLVIVDTLADVFAGNEISRTEARQFIGQLRGLAIEQALAVLLLAHPSLSGMASGTGTSGSTAWSNSVRSRLYLETVKDDDGAEGDPDLRMLTTKKANYGARGGEIKMRWTEGRFVGEGEPVRFAFGKAADRYVTVDEAFLTRLSAYLASGRDVSPSPNAKNYAPEILADGARPGKGRAASKSRAASVEEMRKAMERAFEASTICVDVQGPPSRQTKTIVIR
jgi:RecA-family ATPase